MKKIMMLAMMFMASSMTFADDNARLKFILNAKTYDVAYQRLKQNLDWLADNAEKAKAYNHVFEVVMKKVDAETTIIAKNQKATKMGGGADKMEEYDTLGLADAICLSLELASECNKYDQLPNAKDKAKRVDVIINDLYSMYDGMKMKAEQKALLEGILAKNPNNFVALADMGIMHLGEKNYNAAIPFLRKAIEVKDDNVSVLYYLGTSLCILAQNEKTTADQKKNYYKEAVEIYDKCKLLDPDMQQIKWGYNRFNAYYNYYGPEAAETKQAEADYKK